jgi:hypothetical protein
VEVRKLIFSSSLNTIKLLTIEDYVYAFREKGKGEKRLLMLCLQERLRWFA